MSSLQDMSNFLFISMTGPKVAQCIHVVSTLLHEAKPVLGQFCLHLNTVGWSGHVQGCSAEKRGVLTSFPHQIKRMAAPNSSNEVSICLQELLHWIFLFHCKLLTSSENLNVASTSVRSQPCVNAAVLNWGCEKGLLWGANFSDNTKNNTWNDARGAKIIFLSGRGAGFKMNWELLFQCNRLYLTSSTQVPLLVQKGMGTTFPHQKNVWERCSHAFPPHYNPGYVTSTISRENWLGFKSLWLGFWIRAYDQGVGSSFRFEGSVFRVTIQPTVHLMQTRSC